MLQPDDVSPVLFKGDGDVLATLVQPRSVPMLHVRRAKHHVAYVRDLHHAASRAGVNFALRDDQILPGRMRMLRRSHTLWEANERCARVCV